MLCQLLEEFADKLKTPLAATGHAPGFSGTGDGGTVYGHRGEHNRIKTLIGGKPVSAAVHFQAFHRTAGVAASFDNGDGLAASKGVMLYDKLKLDPDFVSQAFTGWGGDGKYEKWGVPEKMCKNLNLGVWCLLDVGDPAHKIERVEKKIEKSCGWYGCVLLGAKLVTNYFAHSPQRFHFVKDKLSHGKDIALTPKGYSATKFLGHLQVSFEAIMRCENGILAVYADDLGESIDGKNHQFLTSILESSDLNFGMRVIVDVFSRLVAASKRSQSDLFPLFLIPKLLTPYKEWLRNLETQLERDNVHIENDDVQFQHVIPQGMQKDFPLCSEIAFENDFMVITNDLNKWINTGKGGNAAEWNKVGHLFKTNICKYGQLHVEDNGEATCRELAGLCDKAGLPRGRAIRHYAPADVSADFTHGLAATVSVGKRSVERLAETARSAASPWGMETDFLDDPRRPGAVLGPKTVPKRTQQLCTALQAADWDDDKVSELMNSIHNDWPSQLYSVGN